MNRSCLFVYVFAIVIVCSGLLWLCLSANATPLHLTHQPQPDPISSIYFDDSNLILIDNAYYEVAFRKEDGSIAYITDKSTGQHVTEGSRGQCLWWATFPDNGNAGGCSWAGGYVFSYTWSPAPSPTLSDTLVFTYTPTAPQGVVVRVVITPSANSWLDMQLEAQNQWGDVLKKVQFPSDLVFVESDIQEVLLPMLPGVVLDPGFFAQHLSYTTPYPGNGAFADYVSVESTQGKFAMYSLYGQGPIKPLEMGFIHDSINISNTYYYHTFGAEAANNTTWTSPPVRIRISQSHAETINAYSQDNGLVAFPSLREKLGQRYDQLVQFPLYKADIAQLKIPFTQVYTSLLTQVPVPGLLHLVTYWPGGFDQNYPDFLPPDPQWGTTADLAAMIEKAHERNWLVMPYINPTWWHTNTITSTVLITEIAVLNERGMPVYECYNSHCGVVVSPYAPYVKQRLDQLIRQMKDLRIDILFEDQIGARRWLTDYNPSSPNPMAYSQGWVEHTDTYSNTPLMTERGFDRLARSEIGFHGSVLLDEKLGDTSSWWGTGTWHYYPLAPFMVRDKVLFYQHDLATKTMTIDNATLSWNLAFGYMLSYNLYQEGDSGGIPSPWINLVGAFQKHVISRYADEKLVSYSLRDQVSQTTFESFMVTANWDKDNLYSTGQYTLPPSGVMVTNTNGSLIAGIFIGYNGEPLSSGEHYLIEERSSDDILIRQPMGTPTTLTLKLLPTWSITGPVEVWAFTSSDQGVGQVPSSIAADGVTFYYQNQVSGQNVAYYKVLMPNKIYLPMVLKQA